MRAVHCECITSHGSKRANENEDADLDQVGSKRSIRQGVTLAVTLGGFGVGLQSSWLMRFLQSGRASIIGIA